MPGPETRSFLDRESLAAAAAADFVDCATRTIDESGRFRVAVAGGSTPRPVYRRLARPDMATRIRWHHVHVFWGDERCVPVSDPASNYRMVHEDLLSRVPIPDGNVHRIRGELPAAVAAATYERDLGGQPLDLVLLGMGTDGHTASLFPGTPRLGLHHERVIATTAPVEPADRVSLTLRAINEASTVRFWVSGADKAEVLAEVLGQSAGGEAWLPAARVRPTSGRLCWMIDEAAGQRL